MLDAPRFPSLEDNAPVALGSRRVFRSIGGKVVFLHQQSTTHIQGISLDHLAATDLGNTSTMPKTQERGNVANEMGTLHHFQARYLPNESHALVSSFENRFPDLGTEIPPTLMGNPEIASACPFSRHGELASQK